MRIGSVLGPFIGVYWIDVEARTVTMRQGTKGIVAEISKQLTGDEMAGLLEGLMEKPVDSSKAGRMRKVRATRRTQPPAPPTLVPVAKRGPVDRREEARQQHRRARPRVIRCTCGADVEVKAKGRVPKKCENCRYPSQPLPALAGIEAIEAIEAKRA